MAFVTIGAGVVAGGMVALLLDLVGDPPALLVGLLAGAAAGVAAAITPAVMLPRLRRYP